MKWIIPTKLYDFDFETHTFSAILVNVEYDIEEKWKELYFRDKPSGYMISNTGKVKKPDGSDSPLYYDKNGYTRFCLYIPKNHPLYKNERRIAYPYKTHRAVAELFLKNPNPDEYTIVMHKNDIPDCNFAVNLSWGSPQMNMDDKAISGRSRYLHGEEKPDSIFKESEVRKICDCIYKHNIRKSKQIIKYCGVENRDSKYINSFKILIQNIKRKHCWRYIISEYESKK